MDLVEARARGFEASTRHPWETARFEVIDDLIRRNVNLAAGSIVMDVGCGDTFVVESLAARHGAAQFFAVDTAFTGELLEHYRARLNNPRIQMASSLDGMAPPPSKPASLVLLMDVIEHIEDDTGFLNGLRARPYIDQQTRLLITVPAYQSLFSSHDTFLGHYRRYSNGSLRRLIERTGFRVLDIGYFFGSLLPVRILQVIKERVFGLKPDQPTSGIVTWTGGQAAAALFSRALVFDARVSMTIARRGLRLPGLSNYAICVKSA
jgi:methyltransferase family protein